MIENTVSEATCFLQRRRRKTDLDNIPAAVFVLATKPLGEQLVEYWKDELQNVFTDDPKRLRGERLVRSINFVASWCVPCIIMDENNWSDRHVVEATTNVIPLKADLDADSAPSQVAKFDVEFVPTISLVQSDGKPIWRSGFVDAHQRLDRLQQSGGTSPAGK